MASEAQETELDILREINVGNYVTRVVRVSNPTSPRENNEDILFTFFTNEEWNEAPLVFNPKASKEEHERQLKELGAYPLGVSPIWKITEGDRTYLSTEERDDQSELIGYAYCTKESLIKYYDLNKNVTDEDIKTRLHTAIVCALTREIADMSAYLNGNCVKAITIDKRTKKVVHQSGDFAEELPQLSDMYLTRFLTELNNQTKGRKR